MYDTTLEIVRTLKNILRIVLSNIVNLLSKLKDRKLICGSI